MSSTIHITIGNVTLNIGGGTDDTALRAQVGAPEPASEVAPASRSYDGSEVDAGVSGFRRWDLFLDANQKDFAGCFVIAGTPYDGWKPTPTAYSAGYDHFNWINATWPDEFFAIASNDALAPAAGSRFETYTATSFDTGSTYSLPTPGTDDKIYQLYRWKNVGGTMTWDAANTYLHRVAINGSTLGAQHTVWYTKETLGSGNLLPLGGVERLKFLKVASPSGTGFYKLDLTRQS